MRPGYVPDGFRASLSAAGPVDGQAGTTTVAAAREQRMLDV